MVGEPTVLFLSDAALLMARPPVGLSSVVFDTDVLSTLPRFAHWILEVMVVRMPCICCFTEFCKDV